jgi:hypothetical protein
MIEGGVKYKKNLRELEGASRTALLKEQPKALFFYLTNSTNPLGVSLGGFLLI